jgi:hypothetical protein
VNLGEGYFCDTPNSGCCADAEQSRCIAPCERPPCPAERLCGANCCAAGYGCAGNTCCPTDRICGSKCCPEGESCDGGTCAPPGACLADPVTEASLAAARAAEESGATEIPLSPGGCLTYRRTLDGDAVTSETLIAGGRTDSEYTYTDAGAMGREDRNLDGVFDWEAVLTRGTDPEILVAIRELDLQTGAEVRREERTVRGDTIHVVVFEAGTIVNQFDTAVEQPGGLVGPADTGEECDADLKKQTEKDLDRCKARTPKCFEKHGRGDLGRAVLKAGQRVEIRCADLGDALAQANAREAVFGAKRTITINPKRMGGASEEIRTATMCHELMHFTKLGLHDLGFKELPRFGEFDKVTACEQLCGYGVPPATPTKCQCATCLDTLVCDDRCKSYRDCKADMGAICPCPPRHIWYPTYTICKDECPSGLNCFGYRDCVNLNRGCD